MVRGHVTEQRRWHSTLEATEGVLYGDYQQCVFQKQCGR